MKTVISLLLLTLITSHSFAGDGPRYIKVDRIYTDKENTDEVVLNFEGNKAEIFRKSLPPIVSSYPELSKHINEVVFLDEKTKQSILISCANGEASENFKINKLPKTKCSVRLIKHDPALVGIENDYGNAGELKAPVYK